MFKWGSSLKESRYFSLPSLKTFEIYVHIYAFIYINAFEIQRLKKNVVGFFCIQICCKMTENSRLECIF